MIRVTRPARDVLASCVAFVALILVPSPVTRSQNHPISGSIESVDTKSSQKKKVMKYG